MAHEQLQCCFLFFPSVPVVPFRLSTLVRTERTRVDELGGGLLESRSLPRSHLFCPAAIQKPLSMSDAVEKKAFQDAEKEVEARKLALQQAEKLVREKLQTSIEVKISPFFASLCALLIASSCTTRDLLNWGLIKHWKKGSLFFSDLGFYYQTPRGRKTALNFWFGVDTAQVSLIHRFITDPKLYSCAMNLSFV